MNSFTYEPGPPSIRAILHSPETGRTAEVEGIIDTGADGTLVDLSIARTLGLDLSLAPVYPLAGVGGGIINGRIAELQVSLLQLPELTALVQVVFAPDIGIRSGNLLGLNIWRFFELSLSGTAPTRAPSRSHL